MPPRAKTCLWQCVLNINTLDTAVENFMPKLLLKLAPMQVENIFVNWTIKYIIILQYDMNILSNSNLFYVNKFV